MTVRNAATMETYGSEWQARGYCGHAGVETLLGSLAGRHAIVAGNAEGVFQEVEDARLLLNDPVIFAANDVGVYLKKLDHWVTLHTDKLGVWKSCRWQTHEGMEDTKYHGIEARPFVNYVWAGLTPLFPLSGYFAMQLAFIMGASRIVLCGCPGTNTRRFFEAAARHDESRYGAGYDSHGIREQLENEMQRLPEFKAAVRSMSGYTREFFGAPEREAVCCP